MTVSDSGGEKNLRVLFLGDFRSGKSTLINRLLGDTTNCLPSGACTQTITSVSYGKEQSARVLFCDPIDIQTCAKGLAKTDVHISAKYRSDSSAVPPMMIPWEERQEYIAPYTAENMEEESFLEPLSFRRVDLFTPAEFLREGVTLVDTAGFRACEDPFLVEEIRSADAIVFVTNAALLLSLAEISFIEEYLLENDMDKICFVVNQMDRIEEEDRDLIKKYALGKLKDLTAFGEDGIFFLSCSNDFTARKEERTELARLKQCLQRLTNSCSQQIEQEAASYEAVRDTQEDSSCEGAQSAQKDAAYFTWGNLSELTSLDSHIAFAKQLIDKYQWSDDVRKELTSRLTDIHNKQQDKQLNLSVIGEFSSGKSTFINALLRMDLLAACVLQGTTVASTVIEYAPQYALSWGGNGSPRQTLEFSEFSEFRNRLNLIVADNDEAQGLGEVSVRLPSESLRSGKYRIIDTPGLNATTRWHEQTTIRTLQETSDLSIILVDALQPLPDNLCQFVEEHLDPVLDQCVFVITKIDLIPPKERAMLIKYVQRAVKGRLGIENPLVLPYSSVDVINSFAPGSYAPGKHESDVSVSFASETHILEHMTRQRAAAQAKKLISLIDLIYGKIQQQMQQMTGEYEERLALLLRSQQADLSDFIREQKEIRSRAFNKEVSDFRARLTAFGGDLSWRSMEAILAKVDAQATTDGLNGYVNGSIKDDCKELAEELCRKLERKALNEGGYEYAAFQVLRDFRDAFQQNFRKLDCLAPEPYTATIKTPKIELPSVRSIDLAGAYTKDMVRREDRWLGGGAAAGAAIGTAIAPGIGTLLGAFVGAMGGLGGADRSGVNLENMKSSTKAKLQLPLRNYFDLAAAQVYKGVDHYINDIRWQISTEIDRYLKTYQETVNRWIEEETEKKAELEKAAQGIREDMHQIDIRRNNLDSLRKHIQPKQEAQ